MLELVAAIVVDLSEQKLYAYGSEQRLIYAALVSTGTASSPTPTGTFAIGAKYVDTPMVGSDYRIPSVSNVMCLSGGGLGPDRVCIHPAPWQEQAGQWFGVARSHGCIRTSSSTARWLFQRTEVGTPVEIRP